jgi:hypothetical protein
MIEITNRKKFPIQVMVKSRAKPKSFTTKIIAGKGAGMNVWLCEDERTTAQIERLEAAGLISTRHIPNITMQKGE